VPEQLLLDMATVSGNMIQISLLVARSCVIEKTMQACNEKPNVIQEYESGKAIPNPQILQKMSKVLGVALSKTGGKQPAAPAKKK
jgi:ribosome-binding protein aMBF1 (putative translation factor)